MIKVITSPGRIRVRLKMERARARKEQQSRSGAVKIPKNTKKVGVVKLGGSRDKTDSIYGQHERCQDE